jgi:uncharacterized protein
MPLLVFDTGALAKELAQLPKVRRVAFAASCCERAMPNYRAFARDETWGKPAALRAALDEAWQVASGATVNLERIRTLQMACEGALPDMDAFSSRYASAALDAGVAVLETLDCCVSGDATKVADVALQTHDTVSEFIQVRNLLDGAGSRSVEQMRVDPLLIREGDRQREDLRLLRSRRYSDSEAVMMVRKLSMNQSNVGAQ